MFNHQSLLTDLGKRRKSFQISRSYFASVWFPSLSRAYHPWTLPKILSNKEGLRTSFEKNISPEWSLLVFNELSNQTLDYLNFQTPNLSLNLDIGKLKSDLILKSEQIASDYLSTLIHDAQLILKKISLKI